METTIIRKVKGSEMETIFEHKSHIVNVKHYEALNIDDENYFPSKKYTFRILIRHAEDKNANQLFTDALLTIV